MRLYRASVVGCIVVFPAVLACGTGFAAPTNQGQQTAYTYGLSCYVAHRYGGSPEKAQQSYQAIQAVGHALGKSDRLIAEDIASSDAMLRGSFSRDDAYYVRLERDCAQMGL